MSNIQIIDVANIRKVRSALTGIVDQNALDQIESELQRNVQQLYSLALLHFRFATRQSAPNWRQRISRLYFAAYAGSRAVRLYIFGEFSRDVKDHKKVGKLPEKFPRKATYENQLAMMREDRNVADYDHNACAGDLVITTTDASTLVRSFLTDIRVFLDQKGLELKGKL